MSSAGSGWQRNRRAVARDASAFVLLAVLVFTLHWDSLHYGLFMDDHLHFRQLRECDWSLTGLTNACRLELVGGALDAWFLPDCTLRFFRPLAFGLMKLTYTLSGWSPTAMHVASLGWHLLVCVLLMRLLRKMGATPLLAWAGAGLFAIHPGHVATVQWLACQSELMGTAALLAAALCYLRFRGWPEDAVDTQADRSLRTRGAGEGSALAGVACVLLFAAALGCRENTVMFPLVMLAAEPVLRRRRPARIVCIGAALGITVAAYLVLRWVYLGDAVVPPKPYVTPPGDPEFARFAFDKACYYLLGEFLLVPSVPFAGLAYLRDRPLVFYGLTVAVIVLVVLVYRKCLRRKPGLLGPTWLLGFMLPVLPVFAAPHHLYLPGVGWAITTMLILRWIGGPATDGRLARQTGMWGCALLIGAAFGVATLSVGQTLDIAQRVEDLITAEIASGATDLENGDTLYVANFPIIAYCVPAAVEERTGLRNLRFRVLTWSPRVLGLVGTDVQSEITWIDERTIEMNIVGDRYFAGALGQIVTEANGGATLAHVVESRNGHGLRADVLDGDAEGISALRFTFDRPFSQRDVHLFWGSRVLWALELQPDVRP